MDARQDQPGIPIPEEKAAEGGAPPSSERRLGWPNWVLFILGGITLLLGYSLLASTGPLADDWQGRAAPYCVAGGLLLFGLGFVPWKRGK